MSSISKITSFFTTAFAVALALWNLTPTALSATDQLAGDKIDLECRQHNPPASKWVDKILSSEPSCTKHGWEVNRARQTHKELMAKMNQTATKVAYTAVANTKDAATAVNSAKTMIQETAQEYRDIAAKAGEAAKKLQEQRKPNEGQLKALPAREKELWAQLGDKERALNVFNDKTAKLRVAADHKERQSEISERNKESTRMVEEIKPLKEVLQKQQYPNAHRDQSKVVATSRALEKELNHVRDDSLQKAQQMDAQAAKLDAIKLDSGQLADLQEKISKGENLPVEVPKTKDEEKPSAWQATKEKVGGWFSSEGKVSSDVQNREDMLKEALHTEAQGQGEPAITSAKEASSKGKSDQGVFDFSDKDSDAEKQAKWGAEAYKDSAVTNAGSTEENVLGTLKNETKEAKKGYEEDLAKVGGYEGAAKSLSGPVADELEKKDASIREAYKANEKAKTVIDDGIYRDEREDPVKRAALDKSIADRNSLVDSQCENSYMCKAMQDNGVSRKISEGDVGKNFGESEGLKKIAENNQQPEFSDPSGSGFTTPKAEAEERPKSVRDAEALAELQGERYQKMDEHVKDVEKQVVTQKLVDKYVEEREEAVKSRGARLDGTDDFGLHNRKEVIASDLTAAGAVAAATQKPEERALIDSSIELKKDQSSIASFASNFGGPSGAMDAYSAKNDAENASNLLRNNSEADQHFTEKKSEYKTELIMATGGAALTATTGPMTGEVVRGLRTEMRVADSAAKFSAGEAARAGEYSVNTARLAPEERFSVVSAELPHTTTVAEVEKLPAPTIERNFAPEPRTENIAASPSVEQTVARDTDDLASRPRESASPPPMAKDSLPSENSRLAEERVEAQHSTPTRTAAGETNPGRVAEEPAPNPSSAKVTNENQDSGKVSALAKKEKQPDWMNAKAEMSAAPTEAPRSSSVRQSSNAVDSASDTPRVKATRTADTAPTPTPYKEPRLETSTAVTEARIAENPISFSSFPSPSAAQAPAPAAPSYVRQNPVASAPSARAPAAAPATPFTASAGSSTQAASSVKRAEETLGRTLNPSQAAVIEKAEQVVPKVAPQEVAAPVAKVNPAAVTKERDEVLRAQGFNAQERKKLVESNTFSPINESTSPVSSPSARGERKLAGDSGTASEKKIAAEIDRSNAQTAEAYRTPGAGSAPSPASSAAKADSSKYSLKSNLQKELQGEETAAVDSAARNAKAKSVTTGEKAESVLGRELSVPERNAVQKAHEVGDGTIGRDGISPAGIGNYTDAQLKQKASILKDAGIDVAERRKLVEAGVVGNSFEESIKKSVQAGELKKSSLMDSIMRNREAADAKRVAEEAALEPWQRREYDPNAAVVKAKNPVAKAEQTNLRFIDKASNLTKDTDELVSGVRGIEPGSKVRRFEQVMGEKFGMDMGDAVALTRNFHESALPTDLSLGFAGHNKGMVELTRTPVGLPRAFQWGEKNLVRGELNPNFVKELQRQSNNVMVVKDGKQLRVQKRPSILERKNESFTVKGKVDPEIAKRGEAYGIKVEPNAKGQDVVRYTRAATEEDLKLATDRINEVWKSGKYSPEYVAAYAHQELALFHGFNGANGRTGRLVSQLMYKNETGAAALFPKSFHTELEHSTRSLERDFHRAQEAGDAKSALQRHDLSPSYQLKPGEGDFSGAVRAPMEKQAAKALPEEISIKEMGRELKLKTADLPAEVTHANGNLYYGRPAKDLKELDKNLTSLFSFGRQSRDGTTGDIMSHINTAKTTANSGYFSTSRSMDVAAQFALEKDKPLGFIAVVANKGTPGIEVPALFKKLKEEKFPTQMRYAAAEEEFAMTGIDTRQIRGAWVSKSGLDGTGIKNLEFVKNPNFDPDWHYLAPSKEMQLTERAAAESAAAEKLAGESKIASTGSSAASEVARSEKPTTYFQKNMTEFHAEPISQRQPAELRDPKKKFDILESNHSTFTAIGEADNIRAKALAEAANAGDRSVVKKAATMQNGVAKALNDVVVKNKDRVNQLLNLQKQLVWDKVAKDSYLSSQLVGKYSDFNNIKLFFKSDSKLIDKRLGEIFTNYNSRYSEFLDSVAKREGWDTKAMGLAEKRENWHHLGIGNTPDEANIAARKSREMLDENGLSRPRSYDDPAVKARVESDVKEIEASRSTLADRFKSEKGVMVGKEGEEVLSAKAIDAIRKSDQTDAAVKKALEGKFSATKFTTEDVQEMRKYVAKADSFSPDLYVGKRVEVSLDARPHGAVSGDFAGQNARNLEGTMSALASRESRGIEDQIKAVRAAEAKATDTLDAMKKDFTDIVGSIVGKKDPNFRDFIFISGDDFIYLPKTPLTRTEELAIAAKQGEKPNTVRLTYNPSRYADTGKAIPTSLRSEYIVASEKIEKDLRKALTGKFTSDELDAAHISVKSRPNSDGSSSAGLYVGGTNSPEKLQEMQRLSREYLERHNVKVDFVDTVPRPGRVTEAALTESEAVTQRALNAEKALGRPLDDSQKAAVERAHLVGNNETGKAVNGDMPAGKGNYSLSQIREKDRILREAGFDAGQRRTLMDEGIVGSDVPTRKPASSEKFEGVGIGVQSDLKSGDSKVLIGGNGATLIEENLMQQGIAEQRVDWLRGGSASDLEAYGASVKSDEAKAEYNRLIELRKPDKMPASPGAEYYQSQVTYTRAQMELLSNFENEEVFGGLEKVMERQFKLEEQLKKNQQALQNARAAGKP